MKFQIKNRWSGEVQFECELSADIENASYGVKLGFAVKKALEAKANLSKANLSSVKADVFMVLAYAINEIPALITALKDGKVDGSTYSGECSCLVGTIGAARGLEAINLPPPIKPDSSRLAERFFMAIKKGDTPETNPASNIAMEWAQEFQSLVTPLVAP